MASDCPTELSDFKTLFNRTGISLQHALPQGASTTPTARTPSIPSFQVPIQPTGPADWSNPIFRDFVLLYHAYLQDEVVPWLAKTRFVKTLGLEKFFVNQTHAIFNTWLAWQEGPPQERFQNYISFLNFSRGLSLLRETDYIPPDFLPTGPGDFDLNENFVEFFVAARRNVLRIARDYFSKNGNFIVHNSIEDQEIIYEMALRARSSWERYQPQTGATFSTFWHTKIIFVAIDVFKKTVKNIEKQHRSNDESELRRLSLERPLSIQFDFSEVESFDPIAWIENRPELNQKEREILIGFYGDESPQELADRLLPNLKTPQSRRKTLFNIRKKLRKKLEHMRDILSFVPSTHPDPRTK